MIEAQCTPPCRQGYRCTDGQCVSECSPPCRSGFMCLQNECVSRCNPPCPNNQVCTDDGECIQPPQTAPVMPIPVQPTPVTPQPQPTPQPTTPPPPAQQEETFYDSSHVAAGMHFGIGGTKKNQFEHEDLGPTLGLYLRYDLSLGRFLALSPMFQLGGWKPSSGDEKRHWYSDYDLMIRGRFALDSGTTGIEAYLGLPIGFTMSFIDEAGIDGVGFGWNIGLVVGAIVYLGNRFGLNLEVGWLMHKFSHDAGGPFGANVDFTVSQAVFNLGLVF